MNSVHELIRLLSESEKVEKTEQEPEKVEKTEQEPEKVLSSRAKKKAK